MSSGVYMRFVFSWILIALVFPVTVFGQSDEVTIKPVPDWVRSVDYRVPDNPAKNELSEGSRYLLYEVQDHPEREEQFVRVVQLMLNKTGVQESGNLTFEFDPAYQQLIFHSLKVVRSGKVFDKLDLSEVKIISPEGQIASGVYTGRKQAFVVIKDLRVGDVLDYSYTLRGSNPSFNGHYSFVFLTQWASLMDRQWVRILWPEDKPLYVRSHGTDLEPEITRSNGLKEYLWDLEGLPAITANDMLPITYQPYPYIELSDMQDWSEVVQWALPLYSTEEQDIPLALTALIDRWVAEDVSPEKRALNALQFVQDEIRYTGLEMGEAAYKPAHPYETFLMRYGDCKGKSVLLCTMLRRMGISADPALVDSGLRETVALRLPAPLRFDHVIVKITINGKTAWVDPTLSHQGGSIFNRTLPAYGKALVIREGMKSLEDIPFPQQTSVQRVESMLDIRDYSGPAKMQVKTTAVGGDADRLRAYFSSTELKDIEQNFLNFEARYYPGAKRAKSMEVSDDRYKNELRITEFYLIDPFWKRNEEQKNWVCSVSADNLDGMFSLPNDRIRSMPLGMVFPYRREQVITAHLPDDEWSIEPFATNVLNDALEFHYQHRMDGEKLIINYSGQTTTSQVPSAAVAQYLKAREEAQDLMFRDLTHHDRDVSAAQPMDSTNWSVAVIALFGVLLSAVAAVFFWRKSRRKNPAPRPVDGPSGIGGWLVLISIGLCLSPIVMLFQIVGGISDTWFSMNVWQNIAVPTGENYTPGYGILLILEILGNIFFFICNILLICLFFAKRKVFPASFVVIRVLQTAFLFVDAIATSVLLEGLVEPDIAPARALVSTLIWSIYMCVSKRVKATFVN